MDTVNILLELRPKNGTSAAITEAIGAAEAKRAAAFEILGELEPARGRVLLTGTVADVRQHEKAIADTRTLIEQLDAFIESMKAPRDDAARAEKIADLHAKYAAVGYNEKVTAFVEFWQNEYPSMAARIRIGCLLEKAADDAFDQERRWRGELEKLGITLPPTDRAAFVACGGGIQARSLRDVIKLPGVRGAPHVGIGPLPSIKQMVARPDPNGPKDGWGKPLTTHMVEEDLGSPGWGFVRQDIPFWNGEPGRDPAELDAAHPAPNDDDDHAAADAA